MLKAAKERGLAKPNETELVGDEGIEPDPFVMPRTIKFDFMARLPHFMQNFLNHFCKTLLKPLPKLDKRKCVGCGKMRRKLPAADYTH